MSSGPRIQPEPSQAPSGQARSRKGSERAIAGIRALAWEFYVVDQRGRKVWLHITVARDGHEYLKTLDDPGVPRMLLALPSEIGDT